MPEEDKTPLTVNSYRVSFKLGRWQAVKWGKVAKRHKSKAAVIAWCNKN